MKHINVTLAQLTPKLEDKDYNFDQISKAMVKANKEQSDLIVFPELFLTGYSMGDKLNELAETIDGPSVNKIKEMCKSLSLYAVFGFPELGDNGHYYITSALIDDKGELIGTYRKTHLFDQEKAFFNSGSGLKVIPTPIGNFGLMICFDVEFPEVARALKLMGADIIVIVNANMDPYKEHHYIYAKSRAMENEIPVVICNRLGLEEDLNFCGDSLVLDSWGHELLTMEGSEDVKTVTLPLLSVKDPKMNYVSSRKTDLYSVLIDK
ncbi:carbon-nitrogen hydrolase family protein [Lentibacillus salinarum]|uniref:Carbon-nitrogen hydrolase family protein n=1 Tax=Lentibacillus salinarum TaxID=446820 RepID=A0ABW3ZTT6_9BACI